MKMWKKFCEEEIEREREKCSTYFVEISVKRSDKENFPPLFQNFGYQIFTKTKFSPHSTTSFSRSIRFMRKRSVKIF